MKIKNVLISGGAGFLGSHICNYYMANKYNVYSIDNLSTGFISNIKNFINEPNFTFVKYDIVKPLKNKVFSTKFDLIINMASPASPPQYQKLALETLQAGSTGTMNLLELAMRDNARFFHASTSEVYGEPEVHPQPEFYKGNVNSYGPRSMYDEAKRYAEALIYVYHYKYQVNTTIARFFNTYGPNMDANDGRVVSNFIVQALKGIDITIYGDGSQTRSFCYVDDLVKGIVALINSKESGPINLGNPSEFTIKQLAEKVIKLTRSKSKIIYKPLPADDPTQRKPVITLAKSKLNWKPVISLDDGLIRTIDYFSTIINTQ